MILEPFPGDRRTSEEWEKVSGVPAVTIQRRSQRGATDYDAVFRRVDNEASERMRDLGKLGGKARAEALTPERRREIAQQASRKLNGEPLRLTAFGQTLTAPAWERETGIDQAVIFERHMAGWSDVDAVSIPPGGKRA